VKSSVPDPNAAPPTRDCSETPRPVVIGSGNRARPRAVADNARVAPFVKDSIASCRSCGRSGGESLDSNRWLRSAFPWDYCCAPIAAAITSRNSATKPAE